MQRNKVVPSLIIDTLESFKPTRFISGHLIEKEEDRRWIPPDFMRDFWMDFINEYGSWRPFLIPRLYALTYQIILKIPTIRNLTSVFNYDEDFKKVCCWDGYQGKMGYYKGISAQGMATLQQQIMGLSKSYSGALHNLSDELDYKKITFEGLIPSIWVEYYRKPRLHLPIHKPISIDEFEAIRANNTGIDAIDEMTRNLPLDWRSDVRQEAALRCLEIGINTLDNDGIRDIVNKSLKFYKCKFVNPRYKEISLFAKSQETGRELWETIAAPNSDFTKDIEDGELTNLRL